MKTKIFFLCLLSLLLIPRFEKAAEIAAFAESQADGKLKNHEEQSDYTINTAEIVNIVLKQNSVSISGNGAKADGSKVIITSAGTYKISGTLTDGQINISTSDKGTIKIIFDGININNSTSSPFFVNQAKKVVIKLADNSKNFLSDASKYVNQAAKNEPNAALFCKANLSIYGNGTLTVNGNFKDAITSKDGLIIKSGSIIANAADDGIRGKDYLIIKDGNLIVKAKGDGLKSDNEKDAAKGYILVEKGNFNITSLRDAITAQNSVIINDGEFTITTGQGSGAAVDKNVSSKGLKSLVNIKVVNGKFNINSNDDALHSNKNITIDNGIFEISTSDDAIHADSTIIINKGSINIVKSYEGIESAKVTINGGEIHLKSSDDGLNAADGSSQGYGWGRSQSGSKCKLIINGGYTYVDADGDGIDINGSVEMTNGVLIVVGPTANDNGALDYDGSFKITGGFLLGVGSSGMAQIPDKSSTQNSILVNLNAAQNAGTLITFQTSEGKDLFSFKPTKRFQSIAFSSADIVTGDSFNLLLGGSTSGKGKDGLVLKDSSNSGTLYKTITINGINTKISDGNEGRFRGFRR